MSINNSESDHKPSSSALALKLIGDHKFFRFICLVAVLILIASLFWLGSNPVAVGLFPPPLDKVAHFATFGLIAAMLWLSVLRGRPLLVIALVSLVGAADEFHQIFLPGRSAGLDDWATDIFSAVVITALLVYAGRYEK